MDQRSTFDSPRELLNILLGYYQNKEHVHLLVDQNGLKRLEGVITSIEQHASLNSTVLIVNKDVIMLEQVIGVNGLFRSDYSEC